MKQLFTLLAGAIVAVATIAGLIVLETVPALADITGTDLRLHVVLIALATIVMAVLGAMSLRSFLATGAARSLALAVGLLAFAAIYAWHGVFTETAPPFAFLIYGPTSRVALALALPFLLLKSVVPRQRRFIAAAGVTVGAAVLAVVSWSLHPALASFARSATTGQLATTRLVIEGIAAAAGLTAVALLAWDSRKNLSPYRIGVITAAFLLAASSGYFMFTSAWSATWWTAHALGAVGSLGLTVAVVGELSIAERNKEVVELREMNAMKTRFINSAAHELGTPLTPIQLQLSLLRARGEPLTERQQRSIDTIQRNVDRLADLTQSILEGARSQAGRFPVQLADADVRGMLDEIEHSYTAWCDEKGLTFKLIAPAQLVMHTDKRRLHQIVSNFVSNAIKNSRAGGAVTVMARQAPGRIRISVEDSGRGLTPQERDRLFQPFTQLDDPSMTIGSGLGLYITRQLAERLGGFVGVDSAGKDRGSTFFVDLPLETPIDDIRPDTGPLGPLEKPVVVPAIRGVL